MKQRSRENAVMALPLTLANAGSAHASALLDMAKEHRRIAHGALRSYCRGTTWGQVTFHIHIKKAREYLRKARK